MDRGNLSLVYDSETVIFPEGNFFGARNRVEVVPSGSTTRMPVA